MRPLRLAVLFAALCIFTTAVHGDDKPAKGMLPQGWGKLGLSDEQKTKIYEIQNKAKAEVEKLEKQIAEVKDKEKKDRLAVLTADQKAKLKEMADSKLGDK
jgi:hypothetical protein